MCIFNGHKYMKYTVKIFFVCGEYVYMCVRACLQMRVHTFHGVSVGVTEHPLVSLSFPTLYIGLYVVHYYVQ